MSGMRAGTKRALARIDAGETPYAAAKAEGIALSTIYRALSRLASDTAAETFQAAGVARERAVVDDATRERLRLEAAARAINERTDREQTARALAALNKAKGMG